MRRSRGGSRGTCFFRKFTRDWRQHFLIDAPPRGGTSDIGADVQGTCAGEAAASYARTSPRGSLDTVAALLFVPMDIQAGAFWRWFERFGGLIAMPRGRWLSRGRVGGVGSVAEEKGAASSCVRVLSVPLCAPVRAPAAAVRGIMTRH